MLVACAVAALTTLTISPAQACSGGQAPPAFAIPRPGTINVSTATSLIIFAGSRPNQVELTSGGQPVIPSDVEELGVSVASSLGYMKVWRVKLPDFLAPSSEHVLSIVDQVDAGVMGRVELTRFTTAGGYDKEMGTPAQPRSLELWRVRYPLSEINSGNCVWAEYRGYVRIDYDPATIPNTTPEGTTYFITLAPKTGGSTQAFYFPGDDLFKGKSPELDPHILDRWAPELDPTREYCATITAFGDGDLARLPLTSRSICASVKQLSSYPDDAGLTQPTGDSPPVLEDAGASPPVSSASVDAGSSTLSSTGPEKAGCSCSLGTPGRHRGGLFLLAALPLALRRRAPSSKRSTQRGVTRRSPRTAPGSR
jgi:hypothetical protein